MGITNYLSIDVEDYFQVSAFETLVAKDQWTTFPQRVENNTEKILNILELHNTKATFFILGWTAEKFPGLVKKIVAQGHEIACHSFHHRLVYTLSPEEFRKDTQKAKDTLEQITGQKITGYRAPSYSITKDSLWAFDILEELGFTFDSSVFPIHHDRYGIPDAPRFQHKIARHQITEFPLTTLQVGKLRIPIAGGGYFRLFPYWFIKRALVHINSKERQPFIFYMHPWEIDPDQPRMKNASALSKFRHYNNLSKTEKNLNRLLGDFKFGPLHDKQPGIYT